MITVDALSFDYPGKRALDHLSFSIIENSITALVGPNGAGKTTLLRCLAALDNPTIGSIMIDGIDAERFPRKIHDIVSYLPDIFGLYEQLTVKENLIFFAMSRSVPHDKIEDRIDEITKVLDLKEMLSSEAGKLSRGLRQRLAIAFTIINQPKILILDEPASGLDPKARFELSQLLLSLQKSGMTLIVSSHILSELEDYSSDMIVLNEGKIVKQCALSKKERSTQSHTLLIIEFSEEAKPFVEIVGALNNVIIDSQEGKFITIRFQGTSQDQHRLLKTLIDKNLPVCGIQEKRESLQEVYLHATQKEKKE